MREIALEEMCCEKAEADGWEHRKIQYPGRKGAPDRHFYKAIDHDAGLGFTLMVEFKKRGEEPNGLQVREHGKLRRVGHRVKVIDNYEDFLVALADSEKWIKRIRAALA